ASCLAAPSVPCCLCVSASRRCCCRRWCASCWRRPIGSMPARPLSSEVIANRPMTGNGLDSSPLFSVQQIHSLKAFTLDWVPGFPDTFSRYLETCLENNKNRQHHGTTASDYGHSWRQPRR